MDTAGLRGAFLAEDLFRPGEIRAVVTDMDRIVLGGAAPDEPLHVPPCAELGGAYFCERREMGIVNAGGPGHVVVDGVTHSLGTFDFLYAGAGTREVRLERCGDSRPRFFFLSCPAHAAHPARLVRRSEAVAEWIGSAANGSRRRIHKFIHPGLVESCQLVMGWTELEEGSVWNTMPPHTHARRSEVYLYTGLGDGVVIHLMGEARETRHLAVRDGEAVLSPPWSIHCGAGTRPYSFLWGMAGENRAFEDMDPVEPNQLR